VRGARQFQDPGEDGGPKTEDGLSSRGGSLGDREAVQDVTVEGARRMASRHETRPYIPYLPAGEHGGKIGDVGAFYPGPSMDWISGERDCCWRAWTRISSSSPLL